MARHDFRKHPGVCSFRVPTEADIAYVAEHMREPDRREVKRMSGYDAGEVLRVSVAASKVCYAGILRDGSVSCVFGASNVNLCDGTAILWMLSSDAADRRPYEFAVGSLAGVDLVCRELPDVAEFGNFVDVEYGKSMNWVEWIGGQFTREGMTGRCGGKFRFFILSNPYYKED